MTASCDPTASGPNPSGCDKCTNGELPCGHAGYVNYCDCAAGQRQRADDLQILHEADAKAITEALEWIDALKASDNHICAHCKTPFPDEAMGEHMRTCEKSPMVAECARLTAQLAAATGALASAEVAIETLEARVEAAERDIAAATARAGEAVPSEVMEAARVVHATHQAAGAGLNWYSSEIATVVAWMLRAGGGR